MELVTRSISSRRNAWFVGCGVGLRACRWLDLAPSEGGAVLAVGLRAGLVGGDGAVVWFDAQVPMAGEGEEQQLAAGHFGPLEGLGIIVGAGRGERNATSGAEMMNSTRPAKNGLARWAA